LLYRIKKIPSAGYTPDVLTVPFAFNYDKNLFRYGFVVDDKVISGFQTVQPDGSFKLDVGELGVAYPNIHREPIIADLTFVCSSIPNFDKVVTFFFYFGPDVFTPIGDYKQVLQEVKNL